MKTVIDNLRSLDIATVVASGNNGSGTGISYPGCISSAVSVGASTDSADNVPGFSNSGSWLSLLAPGEYITSSIPGGGYAAWRGTSMAAPHVAGAWAVVKASGRSNATVDGIMSALKLTGVGLVDGKNGLEKPRIQLDELLDTFSPGGSLPFDSIIDDRDPEASPTGVWTTVTTSEAYGGQARTTSGLGNSYRYTPALSGPQSMQVSAWWSDDPARSDAVEFRIQSLRGLDVVLVNQQAGGGAWQNLGIYPFAGDGTDFVEISDPAGGEVIADAVRFTSLLPLHIVSADLFGAGLDIGYYQRLRATGGAGAYTWSISSGSLPPGVVLDPDAGIISGIPNQLGDYNFSVAVRDEQVPPDVRVRALSITVSSSPPGVELIVDQKDDDTGFDGTWSLSGVSGSYENGSVYGSGAGVDRFWFLPRLPLPGQYRVYAWWTAHSNRSNNVDYDIVHLGQTDTVAVNQQINGGQWNELGVFSFNEGEQGLVEVSDRNGPNAVADAVRLERVGTGGSSVVIQTTSLPNGEVGVTYSEALQAAGGVAPYTWNIVDGSLPQGLTMSSAGLIEGTPVAAENAAFSVQVVDANLEGDTQPLTLDINAQVSQDIVIDNGDSGTSFTGVWSLSGVSGGYNGASLYGTGGGVDTYRYTPTLAQAGQYRVYAWWTAHSNRSDRVAYQINHDQQVDTVEVDQRINGGQWNEMGVFVFASGSAGFVELSDGNGDYAIADAVRFEYVGSSGLAVGTSALPNGVVGISYTASLAADSGLAPYTWSVIDGSLPQGLTLAGDGAITGVPGSQEIAEFTVQVQDANQGTATRALIITVDANVPNDIIIDSGDPETSAIGSWGVSGVAGGYDGDSLYGKGTGEDSYRYTPDIAVTGQYRIYAWWTAHSNRSSQAAYSIQHADGITPVVVNQQVAGAQWNELGVFTLAAGSGGFVEVSDANGPFVIADAIKLEFVPPNN